MTSYPVHFNQLQVPTKRYLPKGTYQKVPTNRYLPIGTYQQVPTSRYLPIGTYQQVPTSTYLPVGTHQQVPTSRYPPVGTHQQVPTNRYLPIVLQFDSAECAQRQFPLPRQSFKKESTTTYLSTRYYLPIYQVLPTYILRTTYLSTRVLPTYDLPCVNQTQTNRRSRFIQIGKGCEPCSQYLFTYKHKSYILL